uniref:Uncharacterized protein n=1 Tax=Haptolina brevifila TaxID=156173 RepID=A0A7S2GX30_9EUKA|mmetsp:Transcript_48586/g.96887  ORF Transcript_48586/g.96887 Transcript_48586/m.96887 type:complete len:171 (+) Transcript_48586:124-636(+)
MGNVMPRPEDSFCCVRARKSIMEEPRAPLIDRAASDQVVHIGHPPAAATSLDSDSLQPGSFKPREPSALPPPPPRANGATVQAPSTVDAASTMPSNAPERKRLITPKVRHGPSRVQSSCATTNASTITAAGKGPKILVKPVSFGKTGPDSLAPPTTPKLLEDAVREGSEK